MVEVKVLVTAEELEQFRESEALFAPVEAPAAGCALALTVQVFVPLPLTPRVIGEPAVPQVEEAKS